MKNIIENDFRKLDLNLLLVFHALMQERSVTRAAARLYIGQPAVSGGLKRLRSAFADALFVRTASGMMPTPRALELARAIDPLLLSLHQALHEHPTFDATHAERIFKIGISDALEVALMPELMRYLAEVAPGVRLVALQTDSRSAPAMLDAGEIELALGVFGEFPSWQRSRVLFDWNFVCVYDPAHVKVRGKRLSLEQYLSYPHVMTSFSGGLQGIVDEHLAALGRTRRVVYSSRTFATSPLLVRQMPALTTVPAFIAGAWRDALDLAISPLPFALPEYRVSLLWGAVSESDAGLTWLAAQIAQRFTGKSFS